MKHIHHVSMMINYLYLVDVMMKELLMIIIYIIYGKYIKKPRNVKNKFADYSSMDKDEMESTQFFDPKVKSRSHNGDVELA
mmetsp:Transcript_50957/g.62398  ORF Transcript_50957/g.62398 Transcript_50957/m.62398 type:complete len:81 (-) Transcript_50957:70-312(-)